MKDLITEIDTLELKKARIIKKQTTTTAALLYPYSPPDPLGIGSLPVEIRSYDLPRHTLVDLNFKSRWAGLRLYDLLATTRKVFDPEKDVRSQHSGEVYEATEDINEFNGTVVERHLLEAHQRTFGSLWAEFYSGEHTLFEQALHGLTPEEITIDFDDHLDKLRLNVDVTADLPRSHGRRIHKEVDFIRNQLVGDPEFKVAYITWRDQNFPQLGDTIYWPKDAKQKFLDEFFYPLGQDPEKAKRLIENQTFSCDLDIIDETQKNTNTELDWVADGAPHYAQYLGSRVVKVSLENSHMLVRVDPDQNVQLFRSIDSHAPRDLKPRLIAARDKQSGEWTYVSSKVPNSLKIDWNDTTSLSLGLMMVLYNSPDARTKMPERGHFKPKPIEEITADDPNFEDQEMSEIQNVLMASALRSMIMRGAFFAKGLAPYLKSLGNG